MSVKSTGPLFPQVAVQLVGLDGNAMSILGRCLSACRRAKVPQADRDAFMEEAKSGDYDHLLGVVMKYFSTF